MTPVISISGADLRRIESLAASAFPRECCGLLMGMRMQQGWRILAIEESENVAPDDRNDRFEIDPRLLLRVQKAARAGGPLMVGLYHSHPNGAAAPSQTDLNNAWQTGMIWLITAVDGAQVASCAFLREETGFAPAVLQMMETGNERQFHQ